MRLGPEAGAAPWRILLVAHNLGEAARAGTEIYCLDLGRALSRLGVQVTFLVPQGPPAAPTEARIPWQLTELAGFPCLRFARCNPDLVSGLRHPGFEAAFREMLARHPFHLVHFHHTFLSSMSLPQVALDAGLPTVLTLHDAWHLCPRLHCLNAAGFCGGPVSTRECAACLAPLAGVSDGDSRRLLEGFLDRRLAYVRGLFPRLRLLAPSRFLRDLHYQAGVARGEILHLPLGLAAPGDPLPAPAPVGLPRFVFLGNLVPVKRVDLAIEAFRPLSGRASLEIWGQLLPAFEPGFMELLAGQPHIRYQGPYRRRDLPRILAGAAAVVVPSDFENHPLVVREALALRVPVVASRVGGLPELIRPGQNGLLFRPGDAGALRRQILRLLEQPALLDCLRRGIGPVRTMAEEARDLLALYGSLTARGPGRPASPFFLPCQGGQTPGKKPLAISS